MEITLENAKWNCPSIENRRVLTRLNQKKIVTFTDLESVCKMVEENAGEQNENRYVLPVWQNMESIVLGTKILDNGKYMIPGRYCVDNLSDMADLDFSIVDAPMICTLLETIPRYADKPLILEIEAPFSILSAVMNPMDLYVCFMTEPELLTKVLHKIADAEAQYVKKAVEAGARIISLADPVGTMNMTGEEYYDKFCGESEYYLMTMLEAFLNDAIVHICKKMTQSLVIGGFVTVDSYEIKGNAENYYDILREMSADPDIHFTGMTCIHNNHPNLKKSYIVALRYS